jgi:hypothetical protein
VALSTSLDHCSSSVEKTERDDIAAEHYSVALLLLSDPVGSVAPCNLPKKPGLERPEIT